jgi:hypothetical protein
MSQHYYETTLRGQTAIVMMGWDRPSLGYFLTIELGATNESEEPFYSNLNDSALRGFEGFPPTLGYFALKLAELGVAVPDEVFLEVQEDGFSNIGNRHVWYDEAGNIVRCC